MVQETRQISAPKERQGRLLPVVERPKQARPWLSAVIPANDESERLPETLRLLKFELDSLGVEYEIVVVDDGSSDGTQEKLTQMFGRSISVLNHEKRRGIAAAFRTGARISRGRFVMLCPADICNFSFLSYALKRCKNADILSVSKRHPQSVVIGYDKWRWFLSNNYHRIVTVLFKIPKSCRDTHYIKIYRSELLREILPLCRINGAVGETEIVYHAAKMSARMEDVPGRVIHNHNHSKTTLRRVIETFLDLMKLWTRSHIVKINNHRE